MRAFNIADLYEIVAETVPDRLALVAGDVRLTYSELDERSSRVAAALRAVGVEPGDHVAVLSGNRAEWHELLLGCFKARCAPINVNHRYTSDEIRYVLHDSGASVLVVEASLADLVPSADGLPALRSIITIGATPLDGALEYEAALAAADPTSTSGPRSGDDPYVLYTGGTTGSPKGVVWRSEDLFFAALGGGNPAGAPIQTPEELATVLSGAWEPWLVTSPMMHGNGQWNSLLPLLSGRGVVLWTGRSFDGSAIARLVETERPQLLVLVGDAMALPFLDAVSTASFDLSSLAVVVSGGAMLSPATKSRLEKAVPGAMIVDGFGASETGSSGTMIGSGSDSLPRFNVGPDVAVLDDDLTPVAPGEIGKLARRGHVPVGYWNDPAKTAATFPTDAAGNRWAVPGDLARLEGDGTLTLLGRGSSCINTGGEKVHPDEVAHAIKDHPAVADALVVGVPDERFGQAVVALITSTSDPAPDAEAIRTHLRPVLAGYKLPRRVVLVPEIRYTPQGKPDLTWAASAASGEQEQ
jgi:fatty-acyl-CoA synthase